MKKIYCVKCGKPINIDFDEEINIFCPYCGNKMVFKGGEVVIKKASKKTVNKEELLTTLYKESKELLYNIKPNDIDINKYLIGENKLYNSFNEILYVFLVSLQDYQYLPEVIGLTTKPERKESFKKVFINYNHKKILDSYTEKTLFDAFCKEFPVKNRTSKFNTWRKYAKSVLSACSYLARFETANEFNDYILSFGGDLKIVNEFKNSIYGMGFAIACNTIKDLGFVDYCKPDIHIIDVFNHCGLTSRNEEEVFYKVKEVARANNDSVFNVDRIIWLICSGNYFYDNVQIPGRKNELIDIVNNSKRGK